MALITPRILVDEKPRAYRGSELRSHWIYETYDIQGDALVAFIGPVEVRGEDLVDLEDRKANLHIAGDSMLHLIYESFGPDLDRAVLMQRYLVMIAAELIREAGHPLRRSGDDLFVGEGKLSVSIATVSGVSCLVHLGINVSNAGTPIETAALDDLGIEAGPFAEALLGRFADEMAGMDAARSKVRATR